MRSTLTCILAPLAVLMLVYNLSSYSSLMRSSTTSAYGASHHSFGERRRIARLQEAGRAMRRHAGGGAATHGEEQQQQIREAANDPEPDDEDDEDDDEDDGDDVEADEGAPEESIPDGEEAASKADEEEVHAAAVAVADTAESGAKAHGADAAAADDDQGMGSVVSNVIMNAVDTANAAAAAMTHVSDKLASAVGMKSCRPGKPNWPHRKLNYVAPLDSAEWPIGCGSDPAVVAAGGEALCKALAKASKHREVVLTIVDDDAEGADAHRRDLGSFLAGAPAGQTLVVVRGSRAAEAASLAVGSGGGTLHDTTSLKGALSSLPPIAFKYAVVRAALAAGASVLYAHPSTQWGAEGKNAFGYLARDTDIEAPSATASPSLQYGRVVSVDDSQMGWSRYAQSLAISPMNPNLFYAAASGASAAMMHFMQRTFSHPDDGKAAGPEKAPRSEPYEFTKEIYEPAHDGKRSSGVSVRVMQGSCFGVGHGSIASAVEAKAGGGSSSGLLGMFGNSNAVLESRAFDARSQMLSTGCAKVEPASDSPPARPLNWVVPQAATEWPPTAKCAELELTDLCNVLKEVALERTVLAAVSNKNIFHMLQLFVNGIKAAKVPNAMVVALDDQTSAWLKDRDVPRYTKKLVSRTGSTDNHATSGLKFKILVDFLSIGCSVLLSDVDVIWLANPFPFLYRDTDVEGMTDGWDEPTSYGYNYAGGGLRVFARNSGMFFLQATDESLSMMRRLAHRMEREGTWDQTAYNEEQFYPAHGEHGTVGVSSRVMNYFCNMNSKTFFRFVREDSQLLKGYRPVSMHVNYHPEKPQRMVDLHAFYYLGDDAKGDQAGIWKWNGGEGSRLQSMCKSAMKPGKPPAEKALIQQVLLAKKATWGGIKWIEFGKDGALKTPWGAGTWGDASSADKPNRLYATFIGTTHMLTFTGTAYESTRCSDGEKVKGELAKAGEE